MTIGNNVLPSKFRRLLPDPKTKNGMNCGGGIEDSE